jgi:DNA-binding NarL/FixJ family response regulator
MDIGVMIYEDNNSLRETLAGLINFSKGLLLLGEYPRADRVVSQVKEANPDVILMDIDLPGVNGIEAVKQVRQLNRQVRIVMLTVFDDNRHVLEAICAGASGYILKKYISDHLLEAIDQVMRGEAPMSPGIARMVIESMHRVVSPTDDVYQLTPREKEILGKLSGGSSYKLIAAELSLSIDTVRSHIKNIYGKLQVHSQIEAVNKAAKERLI